MMETGPTDRASGVTAQFERALVLFRSGNDRLAHQATRALLERAPEHVGAMMLLLATAGACGDELTISAALMAIAPHYARLLAVPQVRELLDSDLLAPVVSTREFRTLFAPALRSVETLVCDSADRQRVRLVQEATRDAAVDALLGAAPAFHTPRPPPGWKVPASLHLVDAGTRALVAVVGGGRLYLVGRDPEADIHLGHRSVSRAHLHIGIRNGAWLVQNLSQSNGTILNGKVLGDGWTLVRDGDELRLGDVTLDVLAPDHACLPAPPAGCAAPGETGVETERVPVYVPGDRSHRTSPPRGADLDDTGPKRALGGGTDWTPA